LLAVVFPLLFINPKVKVVYNVSTRVFPWFLLKCGVNVNLIYCPEPNKYFLGDENNNEHKI
jgi:hypothetical protein